VLDGLITPYGGELTSLLVDEARARELRHMAMDLPSVDLDLMQISELELLLNGAYSPLGGYMGKAAVESVLGGLRTTDGTFWPLPVSLLVGEKAAAMIGPGAKVALRDGEGFMLAILDVEEVWPVDMQREADLVAGSGAPIEEIAGKGKYRLAGRAEGLSLPLRHDFQTLRLTPSELRAHFTKRGWRRIIAYQARQPLTRAQYEFILRTAIEQQSNLLLHPFAGGDPVHAQDYFPLVRTYQKAMPRFPAATTALALLPMVAFPPDTREVLLRAIVARNYGCSHLIIGGEHETRGELKRGDDWIGMEGMFMEPAQRESLGVKFIPFPRMVYVEDRAEYLPEESLPEDTRGQVLAGAEFRRRLQQGLKVPEWYMWPEVLEELRRAVPPRDRQGFTVFFTGLSGSGKSTLAKALASKLLEMGGRQVTLLDGDIVRRHLSSELGFSKAHRDINVRRIGFVASEITKNRGVAICAPIAPYQQTRRDVRSMSEQYGGFIEIHVATPLEVCESRDRKGLYAKARAGMIPEFTGVSDPYEVPEQAEVTIDTTDITVDESVQRILLKLEQEGYLR
jgi:sulfate adenylyltransferase